MRITIKIMRNHKRQRVPCVMIQANTQKYFFNLPETTQRFVKDNNVKFSNNLRIFFTGTSPNHITGIVGTALTLFEHNLSNNAQIFGPKGVTQFFRNLKFLFGIKIFSYSIADLNADKGDSMVGTKDQKTLLELLKLDNVMQILNNWDSYAENQFPKNKLNYIYSSMSKKSKYLPEDLTKDFQLYKDKYMEGVISEIRAEQDPDGMVEEVNERQEAKVDSTYCYSVIFNKEEGSLVKEKLQEWKLKGKMIGQLKKNGHVVNQDGDTITLDMVSSEVTPGPVFLIIDVREVKFIQGLVDDGTINHLFAEGNPNLGTEYKLDTIVHYGGIEVVSDPRYIAWMRKFGLNVNHLFAHESLDGISTYPNGKINPYFRHQEYTNNLHHWFPKIFPVVRMELYNAMIMEDLEMLKKQLSEFASINPFRKNSEFVSRPMKKRGFVLTDMSNHKKAAKIENFEGFEEFYNRVNSEEMERSDNFDFADKPMLTFLGTGSMMPATYRNVSAINLRLSHPTSKQDFNLLLDCGEGTFNQLIDSIGIEKMDDYLRSLRVIYITHIHTDHNLGMFKILSERIQSQKRLKEEFEPVFLIMPKNCISLILNYENHFEDLNVHLISVQDLKSLIKTGELEELNCSDQMNILLEDDDGPNDDLKILFNYHNPEYEKIVTQYSTRIEENIVRYKEFLEASGISEILPVKVEHCPQSHGIVIKSSFGWKMTYSGDCRPSKLLIQEGKKSTILMHEATFESGMKKLAREKMHSTIEEATQVGIKMEVERLILTHFSQRYTISENVTSKNNGKLALKETKEHMKFIRERGIFAFDLMNVDVQDLDILPRISPLINFPVLEEMDDED